jgi:hypothetical protein
MSDDHGPEIISLGTNVGTLGEGESFVVSAIVIDPDGVDDIIGGQLFTEDESAAYGSFQTAAEEGAYMLVLTFEQILAVQDGLVEAPPVTRTFRAEFFDQSGNSATGSVDLDLTCAANNALLCDGGCFPGECHPVSLPCPQGSNCLRVTPEHYACEEVEGDLEGEPCSGNSCATGLTCVGPVGGPFACARRCVVADGQSACMDGEACHVIAGLEDFDQCGVLGYCAR